MTIRTVQVAVALLALSFGPVQQGLQAQRSAFKVIVNDSNPVESLTKEEVSRLFLKKERRWQSGLLASPVDQLPRGELRERFSESVHGKKSEWIKSYWQKLIFAGRRTPPPELRTDSEVMDFVRHNVGAIGYVSAEAAPGGGVKALRISG